MEKVKDGGHSKEDKKRKHIGVCKRTVIPTFSKAKVALSTAKSGLIRIEPAVDARDLLRVANGIAGVSSNKSVWMFVNKVAAN